MKRDVLPAALVWIALLASAGTARALAQETEDTRFFAIPMARDAQALAETAEEHLVAERYSEGLASLQRLLEEHGDDVLPKEWRKKGPSSEFEVHPGAADWAYERMLGLPAEARRLYLERYESRAHEALAQALSRVERQSLIELGKRWPITAAAERAWWILGDYELENGNSAEAFAAWRRARSIGALSGEQPTEGERARIALIREHRDQLAAGSSSMSARGSLPRIDSDSEPWRCPLDLVPFARKGDRAPYRYNLFPALVRDRVLVSSTLRFFAVDAFSGEILWSAGPPPGWTLLSDHRENELFEGINYEQLLVAPASGGRVALTALQIPYSENQNDEWQGIHIMTAVPERRLFAFDLESGRELWNHSPPLAWDPKESRWTWDGTTGSYAQRMMIAAPPIVAGPRVLVPCYRESGRIDYHVACYEIETGKLLWSTPVVSGQRERNMFGRARQEYAASPLVVAGERVIAQTELGTVAALDLLTGRMLWQSLYRQIELPKTRSYNISKREETWRLAPPVVAGDLVISTPSDSREIVAFGLEDGHAEWAYSEVSLRRLDRNTETLAFNHLLGADEDTIYLAGAKVAALQKPGGLAAGSTFVTKWTYALSPAREAPPERTPRTLLCRDSVLVAVGEERLVLDRKTGVKQPTSGVIGGGNVWVENGVLFVLNGDGLAGYFDWNALLERSKLALARDPEDPRIVLETAQLFARRGRLALEERDLASARDSLREARTLLQPLAGLAAAGNLDASLARVVREEFLRSLRSAARVLALEGGARAALSVLETAHPLPLERDALRDLLVQEELLLASLGETERARALLQEIEERCGDLPLSEELFVQEDAGPPAWLVEGTTLDPAALESWNKGLSTQLWVRLERARSSLVLGDPAGALEDLHALLERQGMQEVAPGIELASLLREKIGSILSQPGGRDAYQPFEERAAKLHEEARAANDPSRLADVARLYPHSAAARSALRERLELAYQAQDAELVAAIVSASLASAEPGSTDELGSLLRLARTVGHDNAAYERGCLLALAREQPDAVSDLPEHGGRTLSALAEELANESAEHSPALPRFDQRLVSSGNARTGFHEFVGALPASELAEESAPRELHIYVAEDSILAFDADAPLEPTWKFTLPSGLQGESDRCALAPGRIVIGERGAVRALDERGQEVWMCETSGEEPLSLTQESGVLIANLRSGRMLAFDVQAGIPLWELKLGESARWTGPITGEARAVFLSKLHALPPRALVVDVYRGRIVADFQLPAVDPASALEDTCWIENGALFVPVFNRRGPTSRIDAFALANGERSWSIEFGPDEDLHSVLHSEDKHYLVTIGARSGNATGNGGVYLLDGEFGTIRRVIALMPDEEPMGILKHSSVELPAPYVFTYTSSPANQAVRVRAVHLPFGLLWTWSLPVSREEFYDSQNMPMPAVSRDCVALAYQTKDSSSNLRGEMTLVFVDKRAGKRLDTLTLNEAFTQARNLELRGLGESLFVLGKGSSQKGHRMEILEAIR